MAFSSLITGGAGHIGDFNRNKLLWQGRAETKRLSSRIEALEANQTMLAVGVAPEQSVTSSGKNLTESQKQTLVNPLNVKNVNVIQISTGSEPQDKIYARRVTEKNTKLLEQFTKSTKKIEENTSLKIKQDTKIRKSSKFKSYAQKNVNKAKALSLQTAKKSGGALAMIFETMKQLLPSLILSALATAVGFGIKASAIALRLSGKILNASGKWVYEYIEKKAAERRLLKLEQETRKNKTQSRKNKVSITGLKACCSISGSKSKSARSARSAKSARSRKGVSQKTKIKKAKTKTKGLSPEAKDKAKKKTFSRTAQQKAAVVKKRLPGTTKNLKRAATIRKGGALVLSGGAKAVAGIGALLGMASGAIMTALLAVMAADFAADVAIDLGLIDQETKDSFLDTLYEIGKTGLVAGGTAAGEVTRIAIKKLNKKIDVSLHMGEWKDRLDDLRIALHDEENKKKQNSARIKKLRLSMVRFDNLYNKAAAARGMPKYVTTIAVTDSNIETISKFFSNTFDKISNTGKKIKKPKIPDEVRTKKEQLWYLSQIAAVKPKSYAAKLLDKSKAIAKNITSAAKTIGSNVAATAKKIKENTYSGASNISKHWKMLIDKLSTNTISGDYSLGKDPGGGWAVAWDGFTIDRGFLKVIDVIENKNTGNYAIKGERSKAYGRYQFMPRTARGYAAKCGIYFDEWKKPVNQDKMFQRFTEDNMNYIRKQSIEVNVFTMWIAHNLGPGAVKWMMTGQGKIPWGDPLKVLNNNLPKNLQATSYLTARNNWLDHYDDKIKKILGQGSSKGAARKSSNLTTAGVSRSSAAPTMGNASSGVNSEGGGSWSFGPKGSSAAASAIGMADKGIKYKWGERTFNADGTLNGASGYDCSSFTGAIVEKHFKIPFRKYGMTVATQYKFMKSGGGVQVKYNEATNGDILFIWHKRKPLPGHTGIALGNGMMVHASGGDEREGYTAGRTGVITAKMTPSSKTEVWRIKTANVNSTTTQTSSASQVAAATAVTKTASNNYSNIKSPIVAQAAMKKDVQKLKNEQAAIKMAAVKTKSAKSSKTKTVKLQDSAILA